jgi:hypothetical protein
MAPPAKAVSCDNIAMVKAVQEPLKWIADHSIWDIAMHGLEKAKWKAIVPSVASFVFAAWGWL